MQLAEAKQTKNTVSKKETATSGLFFQSKLTVNTPGDQYEEEADAMADKVMRMRDDNNRKETFFKPSAYNNLLRKHHGPDELDELNGHGKEISSIHRKCASCEEEDVHRKEMSTLGRRCEHCEAEKRLQKNPSFESIGKSYNNIQLKCAECEKEETIQKKSENKLQLKNDNYGEVSELSMIEATIKSTKGQGEPMSKNVKAQMETAFNADFNNVKIHTDGVAAKMNNKLHAHAFTHGSDIYFNKNKYDENSTGGKHLLAHELTHVVQQGHAQSKAKLQRYSFSEFVSDVGNLENAGEEMLDDAGAAVVDTAIAAGDAVYDAGGAVIDKASELISDAEDWLETEAGELAKELVSVLGGTVTITDEGVVVAIPKSCVLENFSFFIPLPGVDVKFMVPVAALPIPPDLLISGEIGLAAALTPQMQLQLGPICMNGIRLVINPITNNYSIRGSVSATAAASVGAELSGGVRGQVNLTAIVPVGGIPVPIKVPVVAAEGGVVGMVRGIGAETITLGGSISYSGGTISSNQNLKFDMGLAADLFAGAYAQLEVAGKNICKIYWQPYQWHGDIAASLGLSAGIRIDTSGPSVTPHVDLPTLSEIPFHQIPVILNREGFSDDCPILDRLCEILRSLSLLPSQNGSDWNWAGPYGPGKRLDGPLEVYEKKPGIPSGAECRGACGSNCNACDEVKIYDYTDPSTGEIWEYASFQNCNSNGGCREHDAAFDWAAAEKGETGKWAIVLPWHMAANIECTCNNLAGNCLAWIAGLPPYDRKMYFAGSAKKIPPAKPHLPPVPHGGGGTSSSDPFGKWGPDFYHYSVVPPSGNFRKGGERWTDYHTNCADEARGSTGVPDDLRYVTTLPDGVADTYIDRNQFASRRFSSFIHGINIHVQHYRNHTEIPSTEFFTSSLTIFSPNCKSGGPKPAGNEEEDLDKCDRHELPPDLCDQLYDKVIKRFGNKNRDLNLNPDKDVNKNTRRVDDPPVLDSFRKLYNRLDSWDIFINHNHPDLYSEFESLFQVDLKRNEFLTEIKEKTKKYKEHFRDLKTQDTAALEKEFKQKLLKDIEDRINKLVHEIAVWYKAKTGSDEDLETIIERVHKAGTELWRSAWRDAIIAVNRILSGLWPPAKENIIIWVEQERKIHPDKDLNGSVGDIDYIGSLARGYKGAPKQFVRFNPEKFDVDVNLTAPPLAKFAMQIDGVLPDRKRIFTRRDRTTISPLIDFCIEAGKELDSVNGFDNSDPFDVVINAPETAGQERSREGTDRLYGFRKTLSAERYENMIAKLRSEGFLEDVDTTERLKGQLSEGENKRLNAILKEFES